MWPESLICRDINVTQKPNNQFDLFKNLPCLGIKKLYMKA